MKFCTLSSGSSGNCVFVEHNGFRVLVDCGRSGKHIETQLGAIGEDAGNISAILVTHEHIDHIRGVGVFSRRYDLPVYATRGTWASIRKGGKIGEFKAHNEREFISGDEIILGDMAVKSFAIPHDAAEPVGYRFDFGNQTCVIATDIGHISSEVEEHIYGADTALLESNHDVKMLEQGEYPHYLKLRILGNKGHLSNRDAAGVAAKMVQNGTKRLILGHLSEQNNCPNIVRDEIHKVMGRIGAKVGKDFDLEIAERHGVAEAVCF
jgi:phosphoribosyl 1,2-cyclic phosphodiesterase